MWEYGPIELVDSILFSCVALLLFYLLGLGFNRLICKILSEDDPFSRLNPLQKFNYRIFFGISFVILFFSVVSVSGLSFLVGSWLLLIMTIALAALVYCKMKKKSFIIKLGNKLRKSNIYFGAMILATLCAALLLSSGLIVGLYSSTNDDGAFHTFSIRVILDNAYALLSGSMWPYAQFTNNYPPGAHILSAFLLTILDVPIQKINILFSATLPFLIILSIYSTTQLLFRNRILSVISAMVSFFATPIHYMRPVIWGGLPLLLSFYISTSAIGLLFSLSEKRDVNYVEGLLVGMTIFVAIETYPQAFLFISFWIFLLFSSKLLSKATGGLTEVKAWILRRRNLKLLLVISIPILLLLPYLSVVYNSPSVLLQHYASDIDYEKVNAVFHASLFQAVRTYIDFNWFLDIQSLSFFFSRFGSLLALAAFSLPLILLSLLLRMLKGLPDEIRRISQRFLLVYLLLVLTMLYLFFSTYTDFGMSITSFIDPERIWEQISILAVILTSVFLFFCGYFIYSAFNFACNFVRKKKNRSVSQRFVIGALTLTLVLVPCLLYVDRQSSLSGASYNAMAFDLRQFSSVGPDDVLLMTWIKENTPTNAVILVTAGDSGQYLASVSERKTIYSYELDVYSERYQQLVMGLALNASNLELVPILLGYNISYVYIGSRAMGYSDNEGFRAHFNATEFTHTPYFELVKRIGESELFGFDRQLAINMTNP